MVPFFSPINKVVAFFFLALVSNLGLLYDKLIFFYFDYQSLLFLNQAMIPWSINQNSKLKPGQINRNPNWNPDKLKSQLEPVQSIPHAVSAQSVHGVKKHKVDSLM
jgi:hypothetical protein